jgi:hypothetical protein
VPDQLVSMPSPLGSNSKSIDIQTKLTATGISQDNARKVIQGSCFHLHEKCRSALFERADRPHPAPGPDRRGHLTEPGRQPDQAGNTQLSQFFDNQPLTILGLRRGNGHGHGTTISHFSFIAPDQFNTIPNPGAQQSLPIRIRQREPGLISQDLLKVMPLVLVESDEVGTEIVDKQVWNVCHFD